MDKDFQIAFHETNANPCSNKFGCSDFSGGMHACNAIFV